MLRVVEDYLTNTRIEPALFHCIICPPLRAWKNSFSNNMKKVCVGVFDPYDFYMNQTIKVYGAPYLIFSCEDDTTVYYSIVESFASTMKMRGGKVFVDATTSFGAHNVKAQPKVVGCFNYQNQEYEASEAFTKIDSFFSEIL